VRLIALHESNATKGLIYFDVRSSDAQFRRGRLLLPSISNIDLNRCDDALAIVPRRTVKYRLSCSL